MHVKGLELPGYDPRGMKGQSLTYALSDRGGCHLRSNTIRTELLGIPKPYDRYGYEEKAEMIRELQLNYATFDSLIACVFGAFAIPMGSPEDAIHWLTGIVCSVDSAEWETRSGSKVGLGVQHIIDVAMATLPRHQASA